MNIFKNLRDVADEIEEMDEITGKKLNPPLTNSITEDKKIQFTLDTDRTLVDFSSEITALKSHGDIFTKQRLQFLIKDIYVPKFKAKTQCAYLYQGESQVTPNKYQTFQSNDYLFGNANRSRDEVILGIDTSFDNSSASLVNSFGEVKALKNIDMWD